MTLVLERSAQRDRRPEPAEPGDAPNGRDRRPDNAARPEPGPDASPARAGWGRLPELAVLITGGLLLVSFGYAGGREQAWWAHAAFWAGQLIMFVPVVWRLLSVHRPSERETFGGVVLLTLGYYAAKYCYSPLEFKFNDELQHWRTADDILITGRLFEFNPSLPISPNFPGLENVTHALISMTGLSIFTAGLLVMAAARLLLTVALYLLFRQISGSVRVAGLASVLFTTTFYYKSILAMFIYTGLALPLLVLVLYAATRITALPRDRFGPAWWSLAVVSIAAVVVTHHLTSYVLVGALALISVVFLLCRRVAQALRCAALTVLSGAFATLWLRFVAPETTGYLEPLVTRLIDGIAAAAAGRTTGSGGLLRSPLFDQTMGYLGVATIAICLPLCWLRIWRVQRGNPWALAMVVASAGYYLVPLIRLVSASGSEHAARALNYLFIPIGYVLAVGAVGLVSSAPALARGLRRRRQAILSATVVATILMVSGITSGWPPHWQRLPAGRFLVGGYESAVEPEGVAAAFWSRQLLSPGSRVAADDTHYTLMGPYGGHNTLRGVAELYYAPELRESDRALLRYDRVEYIVVDRRVSERLPVGGEYFPDDPKAHRHTRPIPIEALTKFDSVPGIRRVFDSGNVVIYDVRSIVHAP